MHFENEDKVQLEALKEDIEKVCECLGPTVFSLYISSLKHNLFKLNESNFELLAFLAFVFGRKAFSFGQPMDEQCSSSV